MENQPAHALLPASLPAPVPLTLSLSRHATAAPAMGNFTHTLMRSLQTEAPLSQFAAALGQGLEASACLLLGHYQTAAALTLALWRPGQEPQSWSLATDVPVEMVPFCRDGALQVLEQLLQDSDWTPACWCRLLRPIFPTAEASGWLAGLQGDRLLGVVTAEFRGVAVLLYPDSVPETAGASRATPEVADLIAIAFHQDHLCQQARRSIEQLRYVNHLKDDFISTLNHELRTPLTSMMLAIRMLKRSDLTPERQAMYLEILEQQCVRETALVNDLLSLQSLETAGAAAPLSTVNLHQFFKELTEVHRQRFAAAQLDLELALPRQWLAIETELGTLTRICEELLTNARKYAESGSQVKLTVKANPTTAGGNIMIQLTNVGAGIRPEEIPHIFEKFHRGQGVTQQAIPGTGMGLALVKGLVKQLKGTIEVTSEPCGPPRSHWQTCFTLCLPCHVSHSLAVG